MNMSIFDYKYMNKAEKKAFRKYYGLTKKEVKNCIKFATAVHAASIQYDMSDAEFMNKYILKGE